jgi:hypothetical protein
MIYVKVGCTSEVRPTCCITQVRRTSEVRRTLARETI